MTTSITYIPLWCRACLVPSMSTPLWHHVLVVNDLHHHQRLHPLRTLDIFTQKQTQQRTICYQPLHDLCQTFTMVHPVVYSAAAAADLWKCRSHSLNCQVMNRQRVYSPGGLKRKTMQPRTLAKFELLS